MPGEPGVGLDRDRVAAQRLLARLDEVGEPVAVALGRQVALELGDEQAAVGEDQDPERARGLDEARGGDRLARRGRVAEAVAADRARILADEALRLVLVAGRPRRPRPLPPPLRDRARRRRARSRSLPPRPGAGWRRSARSASPRARRSGACAARCRRRSSGGFEERTRSSPSRKPNRTFQRDEGVERPASISASASSSAARRAVPGASTSAASSPSWRKGSPAQSCARSASAFKPSAASDVCVG